MQQNQENQDLIAFIEALLDANCSVDVVARLAMDYATSDIVTASIPLQTKMAEVAQILRRLSPIRRPRWKQGNFGPILPSTAPPGGLLPFSQYRHKEEEATE